MPLQTPQLNQIAKASEICKMLANIDSNIEIMDTLFNGASDYAALVTPEAVAEIPSFVAAGLTAQNILDAIYLLKQARAAWRANLPAFAMMESLP